FGEAEHRPRETASPRRKRRVPLLRAGPAVRPARGVEEALVRRPSTDVIAIATTAEIDVELRSRARVLQQALEQVYSRVLLVHQSRPERVAERQGAKGSNRADEQRMRAVEGMDVPAIGQTRPSARLHRARDFQRELVEAPLPVARVDPSFTREPP